MKSSVIMFLACLFCISSAASAEDQLRGRDRFAWFGGLGRASIDSEKASQQGVEDSALYIRLGVEMQRSHWLYDFGLSGLIYDDNAEFRQTVRDQFGNISTADSTAQAFDLFGEAGYRYLLSPNSSMDFFAGYEQMLTSGRSISNCSNCYDEDINIDSGLYVMPRLQFETETGFTFTLLYRQYLSGDLASAIALTIGTSR